MSDTIPDPWASVSWAQTQWWSSIITQRLQEVQWCVLCGLNPRHFLQYRTLRVNPERQKNKKGQQPLHSEGFSGPDRGPVGWLPEFHFQEEQVSVD